MLFEDKTGNILSEEDIDRLPPWEILERQIHLFDRDGSASA